MSSPTSPRLGHSALALVVSVGVATGVSWSATATASQTPAPLAPPAADGTPVPGAYLVVLEPSTPDSAVVDTAGRAAAAGADVGAVFTAAIEGFVAELDADALDAVRRLPGVAYVEPDAVVSASTIVQPTTSWGLDRIDQRGLPLNGSYSYEGTGAGVRVYVVDSGVSPSHDELIGRVSGGAGFVNDGYGTGDCEGHGTAVAGVAAGTTFGVAKAAQVVPVRVLDCVGDGTTSSVVAGLDWVTANRVLPAVATLSLGGSASTTIDSAVRRTIGRGVVVAAAAGNDNGNACGYSPGREPLALTVGATDVTDLRAPYSNYGSCVDLFAPGTDIATAWPRTPAGAPSNSQLVLISGTSFSAPFVAGAAALMLEDTPAASPAAVNAALVSATSTGVVTSPGTGSPNRLLFSPLVGVGPAPTPIVIMGDPLVDGVMTALEAELGGAIDYIPSTGADVVTTRTGYPGCTGVLRPRTEAAARSALESSATGLPSAVTGTSYGSTNEYCVQAAAGTY